MTGKEFIRKYFINNIGLRILSLVIAIVLWFIFTNTQDPMETYMVEVDVEVLHQEEFLEQGRYIEVNGTDDLSSLKLDVYLRARTSVVENVLKARSASSYLRVYIDLYEIDSDDPNRLLIHYEITDSSVKADFYTYRNRSYYSIQVENNVTVEVPVVYEISGSPAEGYMYRADDPDITVTPTSISLTGPENLVSQVSNAYISVRLNQETANISKIGTLVLKDAEGNTVSNADGQMKLSSTEASVFVPIYAYKDIRIQPHLVGTVQNGYQYANDISQDVDTVSVYGPESTLNKITYLSLPDIDMSQITSEYSETYDLQEVLDDTYGKDEVRLMDGSPTTVTVKLTVVQQEEKTISFPTSSILVSGLTDDFTYSFASDTVNITVYGLPSQVEYYTGENMVVMARLQSDDLSSGAHSIKLDVTGVGELQVRDVSATIILTQIYNAEDSLIE